MQTKLWYVSRRHAHLSCIRRRQPWIRASSILTATLFVARLFLLNSSDGLFSVFFTRWMSLFWLAYIVCTPAFIPESSMTLCLAFAPEQKCNVAEIAAISTRFLPNHLCLGHRIKTKELIHSFGFWACPGRHLFKSFSSDKRAYTCSKCSTKKRSRWWPLFSIGFPILLKEHHEFKGQYVCLSLRDIEQYF